MNTHLLSIWKGSGNNAEQLQDCQVVDDYTYEFPMDSKEVLVSYLFCLAYYFSLL
jgi:hypothetical protein